MNKENSIVYTIISMQVFSKIFIFIIISTHQGKVTQIPIIS